MKREHLFLVVTGVIFVALTILFVVFPRPSYSELEKRDLAAFPEWNAERLSDGSFTGDVSAWFSDSEPYRDRFLSLSMALKELIGIRLPDDDNVRFHAEAATSAPTDEELETSNRDIAEVKTAGAAEVAKVAAAGIIVAGSGENVRAMMVYKGEASGGRAWAETANALKRGFGPKVNLYCMVIPTPIEYYCPDKVRSRTYRQLPTIRNIYSLLDDSVKAVDVYTPLGRHVAEPIYHRTDHHWTPLGAYYAAKKFAQVAKVPFVPLSRFVKHVCPGFVGSMYGYSKDISVKKAPENFEYYTPLDTNYTTTYIAYNLDKDYKVTSQSAPFNGKFFDTRFRGAARYSMFMGGDARLTKVETSLNNGRRLLIIKDSFGNALPPFLFGSFEQVHVVDHRYFTENLVDYVTRNGIADVLMANNIFNAYSAGVAKAIRSLAEQ